MARKLLVEAIGTFFLVLTIGLVVIEPGAGALAPVAIAAVLTVLVYAGAHISGAHYNPAVSLAIVLRGKSHLGEMGAYWAAQLAGAVAAGLAVAVLKGEAAMAAVDPAQMEVAPALLAEFLFTFALVYVILNVATARGTQGNSHYGLSIGLTVGAGAFAVGGISGAVFNPAVAVAATQLGLSPLGSIWVFLAANFAAGVAAAVLFNALDLGDDKPTESTVEEQEGLRPAVEPG